MAVEIDGALGDHVVHAHRHPYPRAGQRLDRLLDGAQVVHQHVGAHALVGHLQAELGRRVVGHAQRLDPRVEVRLTEPKRQLGARGVPHGIGRVLVRDLEAQVDGRASMARPTERRELDAVVDGVEFEVVVGHHRLGRGGSRARPRRHDDRLDRRRRQRRRDAANDAALGEFDPLILAVVPRHQTGPDPEVLFPAHRDLGHRRGNGEEHRAVLGQPLGLIAHHQLGPLPSVPVLPLQHGLAVLAGARQRAVAASRGRVGQRHVERHAAAGMAEAVAGHVEDVVEAGPLPERKEVARQVEGSRRRERRDHRALVYLPARRHLDALDSWLIVPALIARRGVAHRKRRQQTAGEPAPRATEQIVLRPLGKIAEHHLAAGAQSRRRVLQGLEHDVALGAEHPPLHRQRPRRVGGAAGDRQADPQPRHRRPAEDPVLPEIELMRDGRVGREQKLAPASVPAGEPAAVGPAIRRRIQGRRSSPA